MSADKYPCIFLRQMAAIVYLFLALLGTGFSYRVLVFLFKLIVVMMYVICRSIRNVKFLKSKFLQHALFCHVCDRSLFFILTQLAVVCQSSRS